MRIWYLLTHLGEARILLPAALLTAMVLFARFETRRLALNWMMLIAMAALVTTATKVAFMGWGLGWAQINFTGISGHAMFAAAIYPILMMTFLSGKAGTRLWPALALGAGLALVVGVSRVAVGAHSWSEVVAGLLMGGAVSGAALAVSGASAPSIRPILPMVLLAWVAVMPFKLQGSASPTHSLVIRLAVAMSGNDTPFTRSDLMRPVRQANPVPPPGA